MSHEDETNCPVEFCLFIKKKCPNDGLALLKGTHDLLWPFQLSLSLFSCYETLEMKPRLPQFITGGIKAKALDKAGQTNSNQLPLNTHITPLSALLTYKWPIQDFFCLAFFYFYLKNRDMDEGKRHRYNVKSYQVKHFLHQRPDKTFFTSRFFFVWFRKGFQAIIFIRPPQCNAPFFIEFAPKVEQATMQHHLSLASHQL